MFQFQLQVINKITETSYLFNDIMHIPREGEEFTLFKDESGDVIFEGIVEGVHWSVADDGYTVTVTVDPSN